MTTLPYDSDAQESLVSRLTVELDAALGLLKEFQQIGDVPALARDHVLPSNLLGQCLALCAEHSALQPEPIRTVHHFACTGGTLFSKCIAAQPNVQLLSEVDPLSTLGKEITKPQFAPTDMVTLLRQSTRGTSSKLLVDLFLANLSTIHAGCERSGLRLVLRDHAHSHFCEGVEVPERPTLREMLISQYEILSVLTVRHPVESYLSLMANGWLHFMPPTLNEYCRRYTAFLTAHDGVPIVRYEDLVSAPEATMSTICTHLDMQFNPDFVDLFDVYRLTGDSGRSGGTIAPRPSKNLSGELADEIRSSRELRNLISMLGYDWAD